MRSGVDDVSSRRKHPHPYCLGRRACMYFHHWFTRHLRLCTLTIINRRCRRPSDNRREDGHPRKVTGHGLGIGVASFVRERWTNEELVAGLKNKTPAAPLCCSVYIPAFFLALPSVFGLQSVLHSKMKPRSEAKIFARRENSCVCVWPVSCCDRSLDATRRR